MEYRSLPERKPSYFDLDQPDQSPIEPGGRQRSSQRLFAKDLKRSPVHHSPITGSTPSVASGLVLAGDRVRVEMTPYDLTKARITFRHKDGRDLSTGQPPVSLRRAR